MIESLLAESIAYEDCDVCKSGSKTQRKLKFAIGKLDKPKFVFLADKEEDTAEVSSLVAEYGLKDHSILIYATKCVFDETDAKTAITCSIWTRRMLSAFHLDCNPEVIVLGKDGLLQVGGTNVLGEFETKKKFEYGKITFLPLDKVETESGMSIMRRLYNDCS